MKVRPSPAFLLGTAEESLSDAYEGAVLIADSLADRLRFEADRVEQKRGAVEGLAAAKRRELQIETVRQQLVAEFERLEFDWNQTWVETQIKPRTPKEMQAWLEARATLIGQLRDFNRLSGQVIEAEAEVELLRESLRTALVDNSDCALPELTSRAARYVREAAENRKSRADAANGIRQLLSQVEATRGDLRRNESDNQKWQELWIAALSGLPGSSTADPSAVQEIVRISDQILSMSEEMSALRYRIDAMRADEIEYVEAVRGLAHRAGQQGLAEGDVLVGISEVHALARTAQSN